MDLVTKLVGKETHFLIDSHASNGSTKQAFDAGDKAGWAQGTHDIL